MRNIFLIILFILYSYGNKNSTALKPKAEDALNLFSKGSSLNRNDKFAESLIILHYARC